MPAAYASASRTETAMHVLRDDEATLASQRAARATVYAASPIVAAQDLAMAPANSALVYGLYGCFSLFFFFLFSNFFGIGIGAIVFLVFDAIAGFLFVFNIFRLFQALARQPRIKAGKPAAEAIWRVGWYCCRCAVVYFQTGEEPPGVTSGQLLTPAQFKHIVWTAGRYSHLT